MITFDGYAVAQEKELILKKSVEKLATQGKKITIAAILFREDAGSRLYTRFKKEAASRVGITYNLYEYSILDFPKKTIATIEKLNLDPTVTGIIIQKPTRKVWEKVKHLEKAESRGEAREAYNNWWLSLTSALQIEKDVDGLHPQTHADIQAGTWEEQGRVLPATCQAVLDILGKAPVKLAKAKVCIIGKSDLLGTPLFYVLQSRGVNVTLLRKADLEVLLKTKSKLKDANVIVSATGQEKLITGDMIKSKAILIDVGEPRPDIDVASVSEKAAFLTPVPGGVGPMTVVCLMENAIKLVQNPPEPLPIVAEPEVSTELLEIETTPEKVVDSTTATS